MASKTKTKTKSKTKTKTKAKTKAKTNEVKTTPEPKSNSKKAKSGSNMDQPFPFEYTRFEKARIIGSRALQIAMGAPVIIESANGGPMEVAVEEFERNAIPITVKRKTDRYIWLAKADYF